MRKYIYLTRKKIDFRHFSCNDDHTKSYVFMYCVICPEMRNIEKKQRKEENQRLSNISRGIKWKNWEEKGYIFKSFQNPVTDL